MVNKFLLESLKEEGKRLKIPSNKNRALIREYLQSKIIYYLYGVAPCRKLSFIGGTSLRILRDLDRFSEDLDFDNLGLSFSEIKNLFLKIKNILEKEGLFISYKIKKTNDSGIGEFKFENLLFLLEVSRHKDESLSIKINYTTPKLKPETEILVLNRFGLIQGVVTNTPEFLFSQKIRAIIKRKDLQPRDFYDVVWFLSHRIEPSPKLFSELGVKSKEELYLKLNSIYQKEVVPNLKSFKKRLTPFLIEEDKISYLDVFGDLLKEKLGKTKQLS